MTTLREISGRYLEVANLAEDPEVPDEAVKDTLDAIEGELQLKAENIAYVLGNQDGDIAAVDMEIKRLQDRKRVMQNAQSRLKEYLKFNMEATGITKISCPLFTITLAKGRDSVVVDDENALPGEYIVTTIRPDKRALLQALKEGPVDGAHLEKSGPSLRIK